MANGTIKVNVFALGNTTVLELRDGTTLGEALQQVPNYDPNRLEARYKGQDVSGLGRTVLKNGDTITLAPKSVKQGDR